MGRRVGEPGDGLDGRSRPSDGRPAVAGSPAGADPARRVERVTLREVAGAAGVSPATASVVLNGRDATVGISAGTRAAVLATAQRLGYRPNHAAKSLRQRRTDVVALLVSTLLNPFFTDIAAAARSATEARRYELDVIEVGGLAAAGRALERLGSGRADGVILATGERSVGNAGAEPLLDLARRGLPTVMALGDGAALGFPAVRMDDEAGAYLATTHLLRLGHRRIAHLTSSYTDLLGDPPAATASHERYRGYRRALADAGVPFEPAWLVQGRPIADGEDLVGTLLARPGPRPTAAFVFNDLLAIGALRALRRAGVRLPDDLAVVGVDGIDFGRYTAPELTTVDHPRAELGRLAVEMLFAVLDGGRPDPMEVVLPVRLLVRESCGAAAPAAIAPI